MTHRHRKGAQDGDDKGNLLEGRREGCRTLSSELLNVDLISGLRELIVPVRDEDGGTLDSLVTLFHHCSYAKWLEKQENSFHNR